ncbi:MAG: flagellar hook-length control protein [Myxococcales bacterium]|nr:flagellar hook-length control protein [Myxococcales bacterium]
MPTSSSTGPEETTEPETSWVPTTSSGTNEETEGAAGAGLTWRRFDRDDSLGVDLVGCGYSDGANECDPYSGDTPCSEARSVLCILKTDEPNPGVMVDGYMQWSGGHIDVTIPVQGDSFASVGEADTFCEQSFGAGWRMAEFHDGQMWYFWAYGNVPEGERFWVWINDQPSGNCW